MTMGLKTWSVLAAGAIGAGSAMAQPLVMIGQDRSIEGTTNSFTDGSGSTNGPWRISAPDGDYGEWYGNNQIPGNMNVGAIQRSNFDGINTITLDEFAMSFSGGGGPGTSGDGTITTITSFTFTATQNAIFSMTGNIACGPFVELTFDLTGPGVFIQRSTNDNAEANIVFAFHSGQLQAGGTYTLTIRGTGSCSYIGPGGNGSGAGGSLPAMTFTATTEDCLADFNRDDFIDFFDYDDYVNCFETGACPPGRTADVNDDAFVDFFDYDDFVAVFENGC